MMLRIPTSHERPLADLIGMAASESERLVDVFRSAPAALRLDDLAERVASSTGLEEDRALRLVRMLASMYRAREDTPIDRFVDDVRDAAVALDKNSLQPKDGNWDGFKRALQSILSSDQSLGVTAKASDIRGQHQNVYCRARILTDVRPVFGQNVAQAPSAAVITHTLRLSTHQEGDFSTTRDFYVALDEADLEELKHLVERAIRKEATLKSQISQVGMTCLEMATH